MAGDPTGHLSRAEAEVEEMATANDNIFYVPADILSGLGIRYHARSDSITMPKTMAQCVKRKLQSEEEFNPFELDTSRVANPRFGNDDYSFEFAPEGDRITVTILGDIDAASLFYGTSIYCCFVNVVPCHWIHQRFQCPSSST